MKTKLKILIIIVLLVGILAIIQILIFLDVAKWLAIVLKQVIQTTNRIVEFLGYPGIVILMALESMIFPLPSELVMPFAGFLAAEGKMYFWLVILFSSIGSILGSLISYYMGYFGGYKFVLRIGKYFLLDMTDLKRTEQWFKKKGAPTIFIGRFVPVVRHLISIPAGVGKMNLKKFCFYTIIGATLWNGFLAYCGYVLGQNWTLVRHYSEYISIITLFILLVLGGCFVYRHIKAKRFAGR